MSKKYIVCDTSCRVLKANNMLETYDDAVEYAKRFAKDYDVLYIFEQTAKVKTPVPDAIVEKIS